MSDQDATLDDFSDKDNELRALSDKPQGVRLTVDESHPAGWKYVELDEVSKVNSGFSWNKSQETDSPDNGAIPVIKIGNVQDGYLDLTDILYLTEVSDEDLQDNKARKNWLLMIGSNGSGERVGHCGLVEEDMEFVYASFLYGIYPDSGYLLPRYLFYNLNRPKVQRRLTSFTAGSTSLKNLNKSTVSNLSIPRPSLEEQRKIASILYTVDQAIRKTETAIDQRQRIKRGLMQDIFELGVNSNGELRQPDFNSEPFKKTKYGTIPNDWNIVQLDQIVPDDSPVVYGILKPGDHQPEGVPVIKVKDIQDGEIKQDDLLHTAPEIHEDYKRAELREGDLLFTIRGTVGRMAFVPESLDGANITQDTARIRIEGASPRFVRYYFETATPINYFERNTIGQAVQGINLEKLREVPVHLPSKEEQERIVDILDSHSNLIQKEREYLKRLKRLKRGLMQDLLSGEVLTHNKDIEIVDQIQELS
jgi:type I restriction enzyme S subunit